MSQPARRPLTVLLASLALAAGTLAAAPPAAAAKRADLRVTALSASPTTATPGAQTSIRTTVRNKGRRTARSTRTLVVLSKDAKLHKTDPVLATLKTPKLKPGAKKTLSRTITVPNGTTPGSWQVLACADAKRQVRETKEGNNCRATPLTVQRSSGAAVPDFPLAPDPLTVGEPTLQTAQAVTRTIDPTKPDTLTPLVATATDGTTYTLEVPAEALLSAERITMTPVGAVAGLPLSDGLRAGVHLEPDGLMLQAPARLTISRPAEVGGLGALARQTAFLFHDAGTDFHLYPMDRPRAGDDADTVRLSLSHFSTPGIGLGTAADRSAVAARTPIRNVAQVEAAISEITRRERESVEAGNPPDPTATEQMVATMDAYYDGVLRGRLTAAETNAELAAGATAEALAWARQMALLGIEDGPRQREIQAKLQSIWANAVEHYWTKCTDEHDLTAISMLVGIARQAALFGWDFSADAFDKAQRCANFEVEIDSTVDYERNFNSGGTQISDAIHLRVHSTTTVPALAPGVGELAHTEASVWQRIEGDGAWLEDNLVSTTDGSITVDVLERANPIDPGPGATPPAPPVPYVRAIPGVGAEGAEDPPQERIRRTTNLPGYEPTESDQTIWLLQSLAFAKLSPRALEIDLDQTPGSEMLLDTTLEESLGETSSQIGHLTDRTVITVRHVPEV